MPKTFRYRQYYRQAIEQVKVAAVIEPSPQALRAQQDFPYFCEYVTRNRSKPLVPAKHMDVWFESLLTGQDSKCLKGIAGPNTDILSPRGSAKSTLLGLFAGWALGIHTEAGMLLPILYISYSIDVAIPKSAAIRSLVHSAEYREIFPSTLLGNKRGDKYWNLNYDFAGINTIGQEAFAICCAGLNGAIASKRSALVLIDDPIKSAEDIMNPDVREKQVNNWDTVIRPTMFDGARAICLGTRFTGNDIHVSSFIPEKGWTQIEQGALVEDEDGNEVSYWPEMWSTDYLLKYREDSPVAFSFQYMNKVVRVKEIAIDPSWIIKGEPEATLQDYDSICIGADLSATARESSDYTVFVMGGRKGNEYHILDMWRGREMGNVTKLDKLLYMLLDWGALEQDEEGNYIDLGIPIYFHAEDTAYQASLAGDFRNYIINQLGIHSIIYKRSPAKLDKLARLRGVSGLFENGLVKFNLYRKLSRLFTELTNLGSIDNDDAADACIHCLNGLLQRRKLEAA